MSKDFDVTFTVRVRNADAEDEEFLRDDPRDFLDTCDLFEDGSWQVEEA